MSRSTPPLLSPLLGIALATICGCGVGAKTEPSVVFRSIEHKKSYSQKFSQAVFSPSDSGQMQVVLIDQGYDAPVTTPGQPLQPSTTPPLKQVITIRVLWRPAGDSKPNDFISTNGLIDWYIIGEESTGDIDLLHYQGTGFVRTSQRGNTAIVEIRNATLELVQRAGNLDDPLGKTQLEASLTAMRNDSLTTETMNDLQERFKKRAPANNAPPPRSPSGP